MQTAAYVCITVARYFRACCRHVMNVEIRFYKRYDMDLFALYNAGYPIAELMREAVQGFAHKKPIHIEINDPIFFDANDKKSFRTRFTIPNDDIETIRLLKSVKHNCRNSFCKAVLRNALINLPLTAYFSYNSDFSLYDGLFDVNVRMFPRLIRLTKVHISGKGATHPWGRKTVKKLIRNIIVKQKDETDSDINISGTNASIDPEISLSKASLEKTIDDIEKIEDVSYNSNKNVCSTPSVENTNGLKNQNDNDNIVIASSQVKKKAVNKKDKSTISDTHILPKADRNLNDETSPTIQENNQIDISTEIYTGSKSTKTGSRRNRFTHGTIQTLPVEANMNLESREVDGNAPIDFRSDTSTPNINNGMDSIQKTHANAESINKKTINSPENLTTQMVQTNQTVTDSENESVTDFSDPDESFETDFENDPLMASLLDMMGDD